MSDLDEQLRRIVRTLGKNEIPEVNNKTLKTYLAYLKKTLEFPCYLTGMEDFSWEERYIFGYGSEAEYEELKKTQPSYTDTLDKRSKNYLLLDDFSVWFVNYR